jgi:hypothetical protein
MTERGVSWPSTDDLKSGIVKQWPPELEASKAGFERRNDPVMSIICLAC